MFDQSRMKNKTFPLRNDKIAQMTTGKFSSIRSCLECLFYMATTHFLFETTADTSEQIFECVKVKLHFMFCKSEGEFILL